MRSAAFFLPLLLSVPAAYAQAPLDFSALEALNAAQIKEMPAPAALAADRSWGVNYMLKGMVSANEAGVWLNTPDGRLYRLDLSDREAARFDGRTVIVEAQARQADDLALLKVEEIAEYEPKAGEIVPAPYQPRRRQAMMLENKVGLITMGNVRTMKTAVPPPDSYDWTSMTMRPDLIKNVYFVKKPFKPEMLAAHSFLVFTFEKGGLRDAAGREPAALALSIEGRTRTDQTFSPVSGLKNSFGIIWSLSTWEEYAARTIHYEKGHLVLYPVLFDRAQKAVLLREAMALAAVNREGEFYHTIRNNCTNNLLILMNRVLPKQRQIRLWTIPYMVYNVKATMPLMVINNLQERGIIGEEIADIGAANLNAPLP